MSTDVPEGDQGDTNSEDFVRRLIRYARQVQDVTIPIMMHGDETGAEGEGASSMQRVFSFAATRWRLLRRCVVDEEKEKQTKIVWDPVALREGGIRDLEIKRKTLERRIKEAKASQPKREERKRTWQKRHDELKSEIGDEEENEKARKELEKTESVLSDIEKWRQEGEETLGYLEFRLSMVEAMLTQISMFDFVLTWDEFITGRMEPRYRNLSDTERRAYIIGEALQERMREEGKLPDFQTREKFTEWASKLSKLRKTEDGEILSHTTIRTSLDEVNCWIPGEPGRKGKGLEKTLRRCLKFYELHKND